MLIRKLSLKKKNYKATVNTTALFEQHSRLSYIEKFFV